MKFKLEKYNLNLIGNQSFLIGTFFLASALPISGIFFLFAIVISFYKNKLNLFNDKWNYPLFFSIGLLIVSTLNSSIFNQVGSKFLPNKLLAILFKESGKTFFPKYIQACL